MIEKSDLPGASLPDHTRESQRPAPKSGTGESAAELEAGIVNVECERTPAFSTDAEGGATTAGDPFTFGGVCGRPRGFAR